MGNSMNMKPGQFVRHAHYGLGTVVACDDDRTTVDFDDAGLKKFVTSLASFQMVEGEPPIKKKAGSTKRRTKAAKQ
jgi:transcription elongation factor GreA-like protein